MIRLFGVEEEIVKNENGERVLFIELVDVLIEGEYVVVILPGEPAGIYTTSEDDQRSLSDSYLIFGSERERDSYCSARKGLFEVRFS